MGYGIWDMGYARLLVNCALMRGTLAADLAVGVVSKLH